MKTENEGINIKEMKYIKKKMKEHKLQENERTQITILHIRSLNHMTDSSIVEGVHLNCHGKYLQCYEKQ